MNEEENIAKGPSDSYYKTVVHSLKKNRQGKFAFRFLFVLFLIAIFSDFISNEKPIVCKYKGELFFPVLKEYFVDAGISGWDNKLVGADWKSMEYEWVVRALIPYSPTNMDEKNIHGAGPFSQQNINSVLYRHWLGTDELGRDVLSVMIHGTRTALFIGFISMGIALLIGVFVGSVGGYFGDDKLKISRASFMLLPLFVLLGIFFGFTSRWFVLADAMEHSFILFIGQFLFSIILFLLFIAAVKPAAYLIKKNTYFNKKVAFPVDITVSRLFEIMSGIPVLFLIISISAIVKEPSVFIVMVIIGITSWTGIARLVRAEMLKIKNLEYIEAARALGYSNFRIVFKHALPNAVAPVLIAVSFGIANAILIESTLSFLGVGVPADTMTWGSLLSAARQSPAAWWLALFPGCAIFVTVTLFNIAGEAFTDAMDPRKTPQ